MSPRRRTRPAPSGVVRENARVLLLERLGRSLHELALPIAQRHEILCAAALKVWRPTPGSGLPTGADKARWLARFITETWNELNHPCSERAVCYALACAERRTAAHDDERAVLVHGDVHEWNALQAPGGGFKLVDPDGLLATRIGLQPVGRQMLAAADRLAG